MPAIATHYESSSAAAIKKQNSLLMAFERSSKRLLKWATKDRTIAFLYLAAHIDNPHRRQWQHLRARQATRIKRHTDTFKQLQQHQPARLCIEIALDRWRRAP